MRPFDKQKYKQSLIDRVILNVITCPYHAIRMAYGSWEDQKVQHSLSEEDHFTYLELSQSAVERHQSRQKTIEQLAMSEQHIILQVLKAQNLMNVYFRDIGSKYRVKIVWGKMPAESQRGLNNIVLVDENNPYRLCMPHPVGTDEKFNRLHVEFHRSKFTDIDFEELRPFENTISFSYMRTHHMYSFGKNGFDNMMEIDTNLFDLLTD
jgi:hypothetical protein